MIVACVIALELFCECIGSSNVAGYLSNRVYVTGGLVCFHFILLKILEIKIVEEYVSRIVFKVSQLVFVEGEVFLAKLDVTRVE